MDFFFEPGFIIFIKISLMHTHAGVQNGKRVKSKPTMKINFKQMLSVCKKQGKIRK